MQKLAEFSKARIPKGASETTVLENGNHGSTQGTYHIYEWIPRIRRAGVASEISTKSYKLLNKTIQR